MRVAHRAHCCAQPPRRPVTQHAHRKMQTPPAPAPAAAAVPQGSYIDSHTHLLSILQKLNMAPERYPELRKEFPSTYYGCVNVACEPETLKDNVQFLKYDGVVGAFGVHPHNAKDYTPEIEEWLKETMKHPKAAAWGEMGLDYHYNISEPAVQRDVFARQARAAVSLNKPIVIHSREAEDDTIKIMKETIPADWPIHVHCFTSSVNMAQALLKDWSKLCIGFTGVATFKNAQEVRDVVKIVPLNRILLETDGPFMAPLKFRGKTCHPGMVPETALKIAEVKGVTVDQVFQQTKENTFSIYGKF